jgi:hypothetical protein
MLTIVKQGVRLELDDSEAMAFQNLISSEDLLDGDTIEVKEGGRCVLVDKEGEVAAQYDETGDMSDMSGGEGGEEG